MSVVCDACLSVQRRSWRLCIQTHKSNKLIHVDDVHVVPILVTCQNLRRRPDRITTSFEIEGFVIKEVKFFSNTDVLLSMIEVDDAGVPSKTVADTKVEVMFGGTSFVNPKPVPKADSGRLPKTTPSSQDRNSTVKMDTSFPNHCGNGDAGNECGAVELFEHGTGTIPPVFRLIDAA